MQLSCPRFSDPFLIASSLIVAISLWTPASADDWTRFHGPNGTGYVADGDIPNEWSGDDYAWNIELPGGGISSPVVWHSRVFVLAADGESAKRFVVAYDLKTGRRLWTKEFSSVPHHLHRRNRFAASTPCCDADSVYVAWSEPRRTTVTCLSHNGEVRWQQDLGTWQSQHGFGTSPMIYGDLVIVLKSQQAEQLDPGDQPGKSEMVALDRRTGERVWTTPLETTRVCYGTPCIYSPENGSPQIVDANTGNGLFGLEPETGKMLWNLKVFGKRCCSSPLVAGDLLIGSSGSGGGGNHLVAVRPGAKPTEAYRLERSAPYVPTSVVVGDLLFTCGDNGVASCLSAIDGEVLWSKRVGGTIGSSPIVVGDKLLVIDMNGKATVLRASKDYEQLGTSDLGASVQATPAFSGGYLLLRANDRLMAIGPKAL